MPKVEDETKQGFFLPDGYRMAVEAGYQHRWGEWCALTPRERGLMRAAMRAAHIAAPGTDWRPDDVQDLALTIHGWLEGMGA